MSYTSLDHIRHYLIPSHSVLTHVTNQAVTLSGVDPVTFSRVPIDPESVQVKTVRSTTPYRTGILLTEGVNQFTNDAIVSGSVVVASDSSLGHVYRPNVDYAVDHALGSLMIKDDGHLSPGMSVTIWFVPFALLSPETDYLLDSAKGTLTRRTSGALVDGEQVWIDFTPLAHGLDDAAAEYAVRTANQLIAQAIDPEHQFEDDPALSSAAGYRALEIISRIAATRALSVDTQDSKTAAQWLALAEQYQTMADCLLENYQPGRTAPKPPTHV